MKLPWKSYGIKTRESGSVTVLDLHGRITRGKASDNLRERVGQLLAANRKRILLNMAEVSQIDSDGMATLVGAYNSTWQQHGQLKLVTPTGQVKQALDSLLLTALLEVYASEAEALASFH
ncbi:MAG: STAS domain-containing protein [Acidobacteria bacterium]|nr:STAS domain-containing protein [Acidobacteriota bacterium]